MIVILMITKEAMDDITTLIQIIPHLNTIEMDQVVDQEDNREVVEIQEEK